MWIWYVSQSNGGDLASIIDTARTYGISTLMIKSGDGAIAWSQFNSQLVSILHADGLKACAWQYEGKYAQAQEYVKKLRQLIGSRFPVGLAGFPYVDYHPAFPYSVFLGPGGAQFNVPQMYWPDIGTSVDDIYSHTYSFNAPYGRPIEPLGEVAGNPPPGQVFRFRQISRAYGATGISRWDWQESSGRDWQAVGQPVGNLADTPPCPRCRRLAFAGAAVSGQETSSCGRRSISSEPANWSRSTGPMGRKRRPPSSSFSWRTASP